MWRVAGVLALCWAAPAAAATVSLSPLYAQLTPGQTLAFTAAAPGGVIWQVNNATGGAISAAGVYTAPATPPNPAAVTITAVSVSDPSVSATATVTLLAGPVAGTTYYVATTGSDSNPGTQTAPFATLQHAAGVAVAGDTVLVRGGVYHQILTLTRSGSAAAGPITFASFPGETATLDGTGLAIPGGQYGLITVNSASYVIVEGFEVRNYTTASLADVPIGIYVEGAGKFIQIINDHIHNITTTAKTNPTQCGSNAFGLTVYGTQAPAAISGLVISGNQIDHLLSGCSETMSVDGNVDGFAITGNLVHDNNNIAIGAIGFEQVSPQPAYDQARNGEIRGNLVYNITSYGNPDYGKQYAADGIYVDGGKEIVIEQNVVHHADLAIELASEHKGRVTSYVTARNNVVFDNNANGISIGGYGPAQGGTDHCTVVNNTLYANDSKATGSGEFQIQYYATNNVFRNNLVFGGAQGLLVNNYTATEAKPALVDNNLYFLKTGATTAQFTWNGKSFTGFSAYRTGSAQDAASLFANPLFRDAATFDLDIAATSPALHAGVVLAPSVVGTVDVAGNPRVDSHGISIGAYQE
jgi:hypothetical protein